MQLRRPTHRIANDGSERRIAPKALAKFKAQIREMTRRTLGFSLPQVIEDLAPYLLGWRGYFGFCQTPRMLTNLEAWIRRRLRAYLWRQWQNGPNRFKELRQRGLPKFHAAVAAGSPTSFWRMSGHPAVQQACATRISTVSVFPASTFLPTLNPIEPPWYGPVCPVVWEGWRREVSPYPDPCPFSDLVRRLTKPSDRMESGHPFAG